MDYWEGTIRENRAKRSRISSELPQENPALALNVENMTADEIKSKLSSKGIKTRLRCLKKLQQLLQNTLREEEKENAIDL